MAFFGRKADRAGQVESPRSQAPAIDWSKIDSIRKEWPQSSLDEAADRQKYEEAIRLYERDDYLSMMRCATLLATALAHSLYGPGLLRGNDLLDALHKTLWASLTTPPDQRTFADDAQKAARLAITLIRENGLQPAAYGGSNPCYDDLIMDKGNYLLLCAAIAPAGQPWAGNLRAFFAVPPTPVVETLPDPERDRTSDMVSRMHGTLQRSEAGDRASSLHMDGMAMMLQGDPERALALFAEAAELGSVDAMASAGDAASDLGRTGDARFWYRSAANAGHPIGLYNTAIAALDSGDIPLAKQLLQQSAEAGNANGYAALTQIADDEDDSEAEAHWARLGAEAGQLFCMGRYGLLLAMQDPEDVPTQRRAREFVEQAAQRGDTNSASLAVVLNNKLGDPGRARRYIEQITQSGDAEEIDRLRRYGFL